MIDYKRDDWLGMILAWRGTVLPRLLSRILIYMGVTAAVAGLSEIAGIPLTLKPLPHSLVGVALGMLLVFRTNASYDRYWEGRKQWGGVVNASRNLVRVAAVHAGRAEGLAGMVAAYAFALKQHLRRDARLNELDGLIPEELHRSAADSLNPPLLIAREMSAWTATALASERLIPEVGKVIEGYIGELLDHQGACERILKTPVPFAYTVHIRQLLTIYLLSLPLVLVPETGWWSLPAMAFISFGLLGIEEAGVEIEDPFGTDANDLPLEAICETIRRDVMEVARS